MHAKVLQSYDSHGSQEPSRSCLSTMEVAKAKYRHACGSQDSQAPMRLVIRSGRRHQVTSGSSTHMKKDQDMTLFTLLHG